MTNPEARLLAVDWGSTSLRVYLLGPGGAVLGQRRSDDGASTLNGEAARFDQALQAVLGDWKDLGLPALACGMVGSAHGWLEAPYAPCPVGIAHLHGQAVALPWRGGRLRILPGLSCRDVDGTPDVMRGEETQIAGVLARHPEVTARAALVLPGTHSKWVRLRDGVVTGFETRMTGELYAVLRQHSVLGRLMVPPSGFDGEAFDRGVEAARRGGGRDLSHRLFATRTLGLFGQCSAEGLGDYLSGLLIGDELLAGLAGTEPGEALVLVGEAALCERYQRGLQRLGRAQALHIDHTAPAGLWQQAVSAGWTH